MKFYEKLLEASGVNNSWLCVGLDTDIAKIPPHLGGDIGAILEFNKSIIEATSELVCAYKPNSAFYECLGIDGWEVLKKTIDYIPDHIPVILDYKRGDIGNTAAMYARSAFEMLGADAVTVNPLLGKDSIDPFIKYKDKGVIILCLTSNPSSKDIQKMTLLSDNEQGKLKVYEHILNLIKSWNSFNNIGIVVGATSSDELKSVRGGIPESMPILIPGIGTQGGDLEKSVIAGSNSEGKMAIINVARAIIYSGSSSDYAINAKAAAIDYRDRINEAISKKLYAKNHK